MLPLHADALNVRTAVFSGDLPRLPSPSRLPFVRRATSTPLLVKQPFVYVLMTVTIVANQLPSTMVVSFYTYNTAAFELFRRLRDMCTKSNANN